MTKDLLLVYTAPSALFYEYDKNDYGKIGNPFVEYKIKLKNSFEYKCWITNWPKSFEVNYNEMINEDSPRIELHKYLINKFSKNISINDFEKIKNSIDFFKGGIEQ